jgi:hypothetical protein
MVVLTGWTHGGTLMRPASIDCWVSSPFLRPAREAPIDLMFSFCSHIANVESSGECAEGGIDQSRKLGVAFGDGGGQGDQDLRRRRTSRIAGNARRNFIPGR